MEFNSSKLLELHKQLKNNAENSTQNVSNSKANILFPHWNASKSVIRFLPDGNQSSHTGLWVERVTRKLPFNGAFKNDGSSVNGEVTVIVPVPVRWDEGKIRMVVNNCPIQKLIGPWWDQGEEKKSLYRKYKKIHNYMYNCFVVETDLEEDKSDLQSPIRQLTLNGQIQDKILNGIIQGVDPLAYDFNFIRTKQGEYNSYVTSDFARTERKLTKEEEQASKVHLLPNLDEKLMSQPNDEELAEIMQLFQDSLDGKAYDPTKYRFYAPWGIKPEGSEAEVAAPDAETTHFEGSATSAEDILATIRDRK